ncbi:MAG: class I SAM-dependent methyltransferase [bacterium]
MVIKQLETVNCLVCGSDKYQLKFNAPDRFHLNAGNKYRIVTCSHCGFVYLNPRPKLESVAEFYQSDNYQPFLSTQTTFNLWDKLYYWTRTYSVRHKRRKIEQLKSRGKILDIGCGTGEFLHEMQINGWQVVGIEKERQAAEFAQRAYGLKVFTKELSKINYLKKSFDVITLWHVLEHLHDPVNILKIVKELLKDDGMILIAVPNIASFDAWFYRNNWVALDAPRHLYHFMPATVKKISQAAGLEIFKSQQMTLDAFYNCLMSERLILAQKPHKKIILPVYLLRAVAMAFISLLKSSQLRTEHNKLGSAVLFYIHKKRELI